MTDLEFNALSQIDKFIAVRNDPWLFLTKAVYTLDQADQKEAKKRFPNKEYLKLYVKLWQKYPLLCVPKTRRMTLSWTTIALILWDVMFHKGKFYAFVSKKEDDASELVKRALYIYTHLDPDVCPRELLPAIESKFNHLAFPDIDSKIQGFPMGADQLRQFTFSGIFGDESAFWDKAKEFYAASFPTIDGGGRMTLVSSPAPGFFKLLCFDAHDVIGDIEVTQHQPKNIKTPMQGVRVWKNKKNKFMILELHYTADPTKRHPAYKESIKNSMPLQEYLREYELHWDTFNGQPVYPEFMKKQHVVEGLITPSPGLPLLIAFDFGLTPAALIGQFREDQLFLMREFCEVNMGADRFVPMIISKLKLLYPAWGDLRKDYICWMDPSGINRQDTDERSCAMVLNENGFVAMPGPVIWDERRKGVVKLLQKLTKQGPAMQVSLEGCPTLVKGFEGGYQYPEKNVEIEPNKLRPIKNLYSHPHDCCQYISCGIQSINDTLKRQIPRSSYSFAEAKRATIR